MDNGLKLTAAAAAVLGTRPLITWPLIVLKPRQGSADIDSRNGEKSVMFVSFLGPLCSRVHLTVVVVVVVVVALLVFSLSLLPESSASLGRVGVREEWEERLCEAID